MRIGPNTASKKLQESDGLTFPAAMTLYIQQFAQEQSEYVNEAKKDVKAAMEIYNEAQAICEAAREAAMQKLRNADLEAFAWAFEHDDYSNIAL